MPSPRPRYRQVADLLRLRIRAGILPPGAPLPSETTLMGEFATSRGTVREAIALLRAEGLVLTERGRGSYVRPVLPVVRRASERYRQELDLARQGGPPKTSFTVDQGIRWDAYTLDRRFGEVAADDALAALLGVTPGTMVLERHFVFRAAGVPQQMSTSCYPLELVAGTPVADPANEPWPGGNIAQLRSLGITVTGIRELVRARMPLADEAQTLRVPAGVPVVAITRQTYAGERRVVEVADIVIPADRVELDYWVDLT